MLIILDDVLSTDDMYRMRTYFGDNPENRRYNWANGNFDQVIQYDSPLVKLVAIANKHINVKHLCGIEFWAHLGTKPDWHIDRDEKLALTTNEIKHPICSIVYYAHVENLIGGRFMTETELVVPRDNRMVIFSPGILHTVEDYEGTRLSVAVNPWEHIPLEYV